MSGDPFTEESCRKTEHCHAAIEPFHSSQSGIVPRTTAGEPRTKGFVGFVEKLLILHAVNTKGAQPMQAQPSSGETALSGLGHEKLGEKNQNAGTGQSRQDHGKTFRCNSRSEQHEIHLEEC